MRMEAVLYISFFIPYLTAGSLVDLRSSRTFQTGAWSGMTSDRAVDGKLDRPDQGPEYYKQVCAQPYTGNFDDPAQWWVDLDQRIEVGTITVWNTFDPQGSIFLRYFTVGVIAAPGQTEIMCGSHESTADVPPGGSLTFMCPSGTYAGRIQVTKLRGYPNQWQMVICQVQVHERLPNIALYKPTNQTGIHKNNMAWSSDKAVDGLLESPAGSYNNCARVDNPQSGEPAEWWLDLLGDYVITTITLHNTANMWSDFRLSNFKLEVVTDSGVSTQCGDKNLVPVVGYGYGAGGARPITCPAQTMGRYIHLMKISTGQKAGDDISRITLCEVAVNGEPINGTIPQIIPPQVSPPINDSATNTSAPRPTPSWPDIHPDDRARYAQRLIVMMSWTWNINFTNAQNIIPPRPANTDTILVTITSKLKRVYLDISTWILTANLWMTYTWTDVRLVWNEPQQGDLSNINIPSELLWTPDIVPLNSVEIQMNTNKVNAMVNKDGLVIWRFPVKVSVDCFYNETLYTCPFVFGSWSYNMKLLDITLGSDDMDTSDAMFARGISLYKNVTTERGMNYPGTGFPYIKYQMVINGN